MFEQSRETLPVAPTELQRQKEIAEEMAAEIALNLENSTGLSDSSRKELEKEQRTVTRYISALATRLTVRTETAA